MAGNVRTVLGVTLLGVLVLSGGTALASGATAVEGHEGGVASPSSGTAAPTNATISGFVVGANASGPDAPVLDAEVTLVGPNRTVETDLYGFFEFEGLSPGTYTVRATAPGYNTTTRTITVGAGEHASATLHLREDAGRHGIRAFVRGLDTGIPLEDTLVIANRTDNVTNATNATNVTALTDEDGYARLPPLAGGNYSLQIGRAGYEGWSTNVTLNGSKIADARLHGLEYSVEGRVYGWYHGPLDHGYVRVTGVKNGRTIVDTREFSLNGSDGNYSFTDLPPIPGGRYQLNVTATGYKPLNTTLPAEPNETGRTLVRNARLRPIASNVSVTVEVPAYRDRNGSAMTPRFAELIIQGAGEDTKEVRDVKQTDANGTTTFYWLPPGQYNVSLTEYVMYDDFRPANVTSVVGEQTVIGGTAVPRSDCRNDRPECKPLLRLPERTASLVVPAGENRSVEFEVEPERTKIELSTLKYLRDSYGGNTSFAPLGNAQVRFHTPPAGGVSAAEFPEAVQRNASGTFEGTYGNVYLVRRPPGIANTTDDSGTYKARLYPGEYVPRAVWACPVCTGGAADYFYAVDRRDFFDRKMDVRVLENTTATVNVSRQVVETYPSLVRVSGKVTDESMPSGTPMPDARVTFDGDGWSVANRTRYGDLLIPNWTHKYLAASYGGERPTVGVNASGEYEAVLPRDNYSVSVSARDYLTTTANESLFNSRTARLDYRIKPRTTTTEITVEATDTDSDCDADGVTTVGADAVYSHRHETIVPNRDLAPGKYTVYLDWEPPQTVTLPADDAVQFSSDFVDCRARNRNLTVRGVVRNEKTDEPLEGATVQLNRTSDNASNTDRTGADGRYAIDGTATAFPGGNDFNVTVNADGFLPDSQTLYSVEGGSIRELRDFELETAAGNLTVTVLEKNGSGPPTPLGDAEVVVSAADFSGLPRGRTNATNGKAPLRRVVGPGESPYPVAMPLGNHTVTVTKDGYYNESSRAFTVERTVSFVPTKESQAETVTVTLTPLPVPNLTADSASRPSSTDERGLYLQGVSLPIRVNATIDTSPLAGVGLSDERLETVALYANRGQDGREREVDNVSVEQAGPETYALNATVDVGQLPPGRNNFTLVVETQHGARAETPVRLNGSRYRVDVLEAPGWLATTIDSVRPGVTFRGQVSKTVPLPGGTVNTTANGYELDPSVTVKVNETRYPFYEISSTVDVGLDREMPIDTLRSFGLDSAGIDGLTLGPLNVTFDGAERNVNGSGSASLSLNLSEEEGSLSDSVDVSNDKWDLSLSASGSGSLTGELGFEEPEDNRTFSTDPRFVESFSGEITSKLKVQLPLEAVPSVGAVLGPLQDIGAVDMFATARGKQAASVTLVFDESYPPGMSWIAPDSLRPKDGGDASSTVTFSPEGGVGLIVELLGGSFQGSGELSAGLNFIAKPEKFPAPYLWKVKGSLGASVGVTTPWPFDDFSKDWTLTQGLLWERGSRSTGSIRAESGWRPERAGTDRYWNVSGYDSFVWTAGASNGTLVADTFPSSKPAVAALGDGGVLVYVRDELRAGSTNTTLRFSRWNASARDWGRPAAVPDASFATVPAVATLGGDRALAVWRHSRPDAGGPVVALRNASLRYAVFDGSNWGATRTLADREGLPGRAALASDGSAVVAAWKTVPSGYPLDVSGVDVEVARLDGGGNVTPVTVAAGVNVVGQPVVAAAGGRVLLAYTGDADGDPSTTGDRRIYVVRNDGAGWGQPTAVTGPGDVGSPAVSAVRPAVAWVENRSTIRAASYAGAWSAPVELNRSGAVTDLRLLTAGTERILAWRALGESVRSLHYARLGPGAGRLRDPAQVSGDRVVVDAGVDVLAGGRSLLSVAQTRTNATVNESDPPDLRANNRSLAVTDAPLVAVDRVRQDFGTVVVGTTTTANVTVTNRGGVPLEVTGVTLTGPNASAFTVRGPLPGVLAPGVARNLTVSFAPNATGDRTASLDVATNDSVVPTLSVDLAGDSGGVAVRALSASDATVAPGENLTVSATLTNTGPARTTATATLRFGGSVVATRNVTLSTGVSTSVTVPVNTSGLSAGTYRYAVATSTHTAAGSLRVTSCSLSSIARQYDADGDCAIAIGELGQAAADYARGRIPIGELGRVAAAYAATQ